MRRFFVIALLCLAQGCGPAVTGSGSPSTGSGPKSATPDTASASPGSQSEAPREMQGVRFSPVYGQVRYTEAMTLPRGATLSLWAQGLVKPCQLLVVAYKPNGPAAGAPEAYLVRADRGTQKLDLHLNQTSFVFVVALTEDSPEIARIQPWVEDWKEPGSQAALFDRLTEWNVDPTKAMARCGELPAELGAAASTSAQTGTRQSIPADDEPVNDGAKTEGATRPDKNDVQLFDWVSEADWVACSRDRPGVHLYRINVAP